MEIEKKIQSMGLSLLPTSPPAGNYVRAVRVGNLIFLGGSIAMGEKGIVQGRLGENITVEEAYEGAKLAALGLLSVLKAEVGDLDKVTRIVKLLCFVNAVPGCADMPKVANGASDLLVALFGERGRHARSTIGVATVGAGSCVGMEMIVEVQ